MMMSFRDFREGPMTKFTPLHALVACIFIFCSLWTSAYTQTIQYDNQRIEKLEIIVENIAPNATFDTRSVLSRIRTREGDFFSHTDFDNDLKTLSKDFDKVIPFFANLNGGMHVTLRIWPKPTIRSIDWEGNTRISNTRLQKELGIAPFSVFDRLAFNKAFHKIKAFYVKKGFFEAELDYKISVDKECNQVDILIITNEGRAGKIKKIRFNGFTCDEREDLIDLMITKKYNLFTSWMSGEGNYNEEAVQQDQLAILNYIQNEGFADAKVDIKVGATDSCNRIILEVDLDRGESYLFGTIDVRGNSLFSECEVRKNLTISEGEPYSPDEIRNTIRRVTEFYGRRGYIDAVIDFDLDLDHDCRIYNMTLTIEEGDQYCVGMLQVFGNCSTQTRVILHETLLVPGETFNTEKLLRTEERLRNIGYFKNVNVYAVKADDPDNSIGGCYRDVHIEVEETNTGNFSLSGGFSSAEKLFVGLSLTEKNFNYMGLKNLWNDGFIALRGGGEYFHINTTFGSKSTKYELGWTKPYFMDTKWVVGFDLESSDTRYISHDYNIKALMFTLHGSYEYNAFVRIGLHYRLRNSKLDLHEEDWAKKQAKADKEQDPDKRERLQKELTDRDEAIEKFKKLEKLDGLISAIGTTLSYDSTNHPMMPSSGFRSRLTAEIAGIGGYHSFIGLGYLNSYYYPLHHNGVLKFRGDIRFIIPYGSTNSSDIPVDEKLFLGGDTQVRGYRQYRLGPKVVDKDDPVGGLSLQYFSLEYDYKMMNNLNTFLFFDAGSLTDHVCHFAHLYQSAGYGIRTKIIPSLPPITLGLGYPINPKCRSDVKKFFFQIGGRF